MKSGPGAPCPAGCRQGAPRRGRVAGSLFSLLACILAASSCTRDSSGNCDRQNFEGTPYIVCEFSPSEDDIRLFLADEDGQPFGQFERVEDHLEQTDRQLTFAMNAGMYHPDRSPVGLYVEGGRVIRSIVKSAGPGNFGMLPNGVFWLDGSSAGVEETGRYEMRFAQAPPRFATQSGPMLVISGELHPSLNPSGTSLRRRNGVGISEDRQRLYFVISDMPVNFHSFARFFRDRLQTPDALYLDGAVSRIYVPSLDRYESGNDLGPIVAVTLPRGAGER